MAIKLIFLRKQASAVTYIRRMPKHPSDYAGTPVPSNFPQTEVPANPGNRQIIKKNTAALFAAAAAGIPQI